MRITGRKHFYVLDSGTTVNTENGMTKQGTGLPHFIRRTIRSLGLDSANGNIKAERISRGRIAFWDVEADFIPLENSPRLLSMGERCVHNDFSFLWLRQRYPCFILDKLGQIVIFDIDALCPIWCPEMETSEKFFGTFDLMHNIFRRQCGV